MVTNNLPLMFQSLKRFLSEEKELLTDLAHDVAMARDPFSHRDAQRSYDLQLARIKAIQESLSVVVDCQKL